MRGGIALNRIKQGNFLNGFLRKFPASTARRGSSENPCDPPQPSYRPHAKGNTFFTRLKCFLFLVLMWVEDARRRRSGKAKLQLPRVEPRMRAEEEISFRKNKGKALFLHLISSFRYLATVYVVYLEKLLRV